MILGVGCDIVSLERIKHIHKKEGFLRILSEDETKLYQALAPSRQVEWLAGHFAAKEAIIKAMAAHTDLLLSQISVIYEGKRPVCHLEGVKLSLSISHEQAYAIAYAIAEVM